MRIVVHKGVRAGVQVSPGHAATLRIATAGARRAQETLRALVIEPPTSSERLAQRLARASTRWFLAISGVGWCAANELLAATGLPCAEVFPFRGLQRAMILASVLAVFITARARAARVARARRACTARRELDEALDGIEATLLALSRGIPLGAATEASAASSTFH